MSALRDAAAAVLVLRAAERRGLEGAELLELAGVVAIDRLIDTGSSPASLRVLRHAMDGGSLTRDDIDDALKDLDERLLNEALAVAPRGAR